MTEKGTIGASGVYAFRMKRLDSSGAVITALNGDSSTGNANEKKGKVVVVK